MVVKSIEKVFLQNWEDKFIKLSTTVGNPFQSNGCLFCHSRPGGCAAI